jgi:hypothetical protein
MQKISEERGDVPEATEPDTVMNIGEILIWESRRDRLMRCQLSNAK